MYSFSKNEVILSIDKCMECTDICLVSLFNVLGGKPVVHVGKPGKFHVHLFQPVSL